MKRVIAWFASNSVAANLLMLGLLLGGLLMIPSIRQEEFPNIDIAVVQVSVPYLGAAPEEVEQGVCLRIEEALDGTVGVDRMNTVASEGVCSVSLELEDGTDTIWALGEIESRVGAISTFPVETEKPQVSLVTIRQGVLVVVVSGDIPEVTLKELAHQMRDEIVEIDGISQVGVEFTRPYEISIEVAEQQLRRYGLSLQQVAGAVRQSSLDMPGGSIKTDSGEILLRSMGQLYRGEEFEKLVVLSRADGTTVRVGDIGTVVDGFSEGKLRATFNGRPAVMLRVSQVGQEDILGIAKSVKDYVARKGPQLPEGVTLDITEDRSDDLAVRLSTVLRSAGGGLVLVLIFLSLFLQFRLAVWVAIGIPIAVLGTLILFPILGLTINSLSLIGFVLVLGILVDDGIVIAERIHTHQQRNPEDSTAAAISGAQEVAIPVIFGVLTTIVAFLPLVLLPGRMGGFFGALAWTVIVALVFSIIESQLILPTHLDHSHRRRQASRARQEARGTAKAPGTRWRDKPVRALDALSRKVYQPLLDRAIEWRFLTLATAVGALILAVGVVGSGRVVFQFFPNITRDQVQATLTMPFGTPVEVTEGIVRRIEGAARQLEGETAESESAPVVRTIQTVVGRHSGGGGPQASFEAPAEAHLGEVSLALSPATERAVSTNDLVSRWRALAGPVPEAVELRFEAASFGAGDAVNIQLAGRDIDDLRLAAGDLRSELSGYDGVFDISDSFRAGKREIKLSILPEAELLGLSQTDLARQVREAFYGAEVQRIQRGSHEIRVMVRYPEHHRRSIGDLENLRIRTADGTEVPFATVARADYGHGYASIRRTDRKRVISVRADVDRTVTTPEEVLASLGAGKIRDILDRYPGVSYSLEGEQRERNRSMSGLGAGFGIALIVIYGVLAIPLKSYRQPLVIMSAIPFGAIGAILGHLIMSWDLVFFSILGIVALSGVVVNDSLVLVDFINRKRADGADLIEAVKHGGRERFRPILLTSVTTLVGLLPLMFNTNPVVFPLVPIAISLGFGIVFATVITLVLVPAAYVIAETPKDRPEPSGERRALDPIAPLPTQG